MAWMGGALLADLANKGEIIKDKANMALTDKAGMPASSSRRRFLERGAAACASTAMTLPLAAHAEAAADNLPPNVPSRMRKQGSGFIPEITGAGARR